MIVVAGGGGLLGRQVVSDLVSRGEQVRVLVRDAERARSLFGDHVEVVAADVRRAADLQGLIGGASVVISAVHGFLGGRGAGPAEVDLAGNANLIDAAAAIGAAVVLVSAVGAAVDSPLDLFRAKHAAEQYLRASGTGWTIVRAGPFLQTWLVVLTQTAGRSGQPLIFGRGVQPIAFVSMVDVAWIVSRAATDPSLRSQLLEVTGDPMTMTELAHAVQAAHGWHGPVRHLPPQLLRALATLARPVNPAFARKNRAALLLDTAPLTAHTDLAVLLGRTPQQVRDVLATLHPS
ncbi:MAG: NAD(P)H-binding protein [Allobranchiibius sp.]